MAFNAINLPTRQVLMSTQRQKPALRQGKDWTDWFQCQPCRLETVRPWGSYLTFHWPHLQNGNQVKSKIKYNTKSSVLLRAMSDTKCSVSVSYSQVP